MYKVYLVFFCIAHASAEKRSEKIERYFSNRLPIQRTGTNISFSQAYTIILK